MNEPYSGNGCTFGIDPATITGKIAQKSSQAGYAQVAGPPRQMGPVESEALRTCQLANNVLTAIDALERRIAGILGEEDPSADAEKSEQPSCELHGKLTNTCENLTRALRRIQEINSRVRL